MEGKKESKSLDIAKYEIFMKILEGYKLINDNAALFENFWACDGCYLVHNISDKRIWYYSHQYCEECSKDETVDKSERTVEKSRLNSYYHCEDCKNIYRKVHDDTEESECCYLDPENDNNVCSKYLRTCKKCKDIKLKKND